MQNIYYWNYVNQWKIDGEYLIIGKEKFKGSVTKLFPEFYFYAQDGIDVDNLPDLSDKVNKKIIKIFTRDLIKKGILRNTINTPSEIFESQSKYIKSIYDDKYFFESENVEKFKKEQKSRFINMHNDNDEIALDNEISIPDFIINRKSVRNYDINKKISFNTISNLLGALKKVKDEERFYYPSAGGLYPINVYIYFKEDRVEGIKQGLYFYNPVDNSLRLVNSNCSINDESQFFTNKNIFKTSAFTMYLTYDSESNFPKYKSDGYFYGLLDCGAMVSLMNYIASYLGLGSCSIGSMNFDSIKDFFKLKQNEEYIHSIEFGYENNEN
ncbi:MAG: SagB/ThcOx family dehydrogenase [Clostridium sp.]|nr:SagB/ThcOx family dehydrogenase [Clostridium sp.]